MREASEFTEEELAEWKAKIDGMGQLECATLLRFTKAGHPIFRSDLPLYKYFQEHFKAVGGMTPEVSKQMGWDY